MATLSTHRLENPQQFRTIHQSICLVAAGSSVSVTCYWVSTTFLLHRSQSHSTVFSVCSQELLSENISGATPGPTAADHELREFGTGSRVSLRSPGTCRHAMAYLFSETPLTSLLATLCSPPSRSIVEGVFMRRLESGDRERQPAGRRLRKPNPRAASGETFQGQRAPGAARALIEA